ncbi:hypothetical protein [Myxosarcina sp. GI1]|uniref:hypothetical protein n=1 Tax=Myxosarcina sp. GI1 TaxID=1541065 RepID=UPI0006922555|nr:hypothetical protein [Myxosarcina sp. GI1]
MKTKQLTPSLGRKEASRQVKDLVESLIAIADTEQLEKLAASLQPKKVSNEEVELAKEIAGDDYTDEPSWPLELANLHRLYQRRQRLLEKSLTSTEVADLLDWKTRKTIHDKLKANSILGIKDKGIYRFPAWQFDPEGDDGILDGLPQVLEALKVSDFTKLNWLSKPHPAFDNCTPVEMLKQGNIHDVLVEARAVNTF